MLDSPYRYWILRIVESVSCRFEGLNEYQRTAMSKACSASIGGVGCTDKRQRCEADACPTVPTPRGSKLLPTPQTNGVFLLPGNHLPHVYSVHVPPKQTSRRVATLCLMDERKFKRESQSLTLFSSHAKTPRLAACQMINPKKDAISWDISSDEDPFPTFPLTRSPPELHSIWGKLTSPDIWRSCSAAPPEEGHLTTSSSFRGKPTE